MIIEMNNSFGDLTQGECFILANSEDKRLLMRTETVFGADNDYYFNAVSLCDGELHSYNNDMEVIPVPARVLF